MAFFSFGGSKDSFFGDVKVHGNSSVEFFTEKHTVMACDDIVYLVFQG